MILAEEVAARAKRRVLVFIFIEGTAACQLMFCRWKTVKESKERWDRYLNLHLVLHVAVRYWLIQLREICVVVDWGAAVILYLDGGENETKPLTLTRRGYANAISWMVVFCWEERDTLEIEGKEYRNKEGNARFDSRVESCEDYEEKRCVMLLKRRNQGSLGVLIFCHFRRAGKARFKHDEERFNWRIMQELLALNWLFCRCFIFYSDFSSNINFLYATGALNAGTRCNWRGF